MAIPYTTEYALGEFQLHGEYQLQEKLKSISLTTVFDAGCNIGEWTRMCRSFQPTATIHMFELVPATFKKLLTNAVLDDLMIPNSYGLSNEFREISVKLVPDNDRVSTTVLDVIHDNSVISSGIVVPGNVYTKCHGIDYIDYLKIDTEGHEYNVLQGFSSLLQQGRIGCIQFEYGYLSVLTKNMLIDFYKMLTPLGYQLGKMTHAGVLFKDFNLTDENFNGPDYVAVHTSRPDIMAAVR